MSHTPGPWFVVIDDDGNPLSGRPSVQAAPELDCGIVHWDGFVQEHWRSARGNKEIHANARLIAAAPDLLAAAIAQEELMRTPGDPSENIQRVIKMRRAALSKATA